jgi:predicted branched-subunit amino acid permease
MLKAGLSLGQATGMTLIVFAGSAQIATAPLMVGGTPVAIVLMTALVINLRFLIYAATFAPRFRDESWSRKLLLGYLSADISFVVFMQRLGSEPERPFAAEFLLGAAGANWLVWQISSLLGIILASFIPASWGLDFAGTLALVALVIPLLHSGPARLGVATTALAALLTQGWPLRLGILGATAAGIAVALLVERFCEPVKDRSPRAARTKP